MSILLWQKPGLKTKRHKSGGSVHEKHGPAVFLSSERLNIKIKTEIALCISSDPLRSRGQDGIKHARIFVRGNVGYERKWGGRYSLAAVQA